jgi:hypothetical protein
MVILRLETNRSLSEAKHRARKSSSKGVSQGVFSTNNRIVRRQHYHREKNEFV